MDPLDLDLRIVYLYPDLLNVYGDRGNVLCLAQRARWRGIRVEVIPVGLGEPLPEGDLYFLGGGQDAEQARAAGDLMEVKGPALRAAAEGGAVILAICGGYQLLGKQFLTYTGELIPGLGILDVETVGGQVRMIGNIAVEASFRGRSGTLVGFENHSGRTLLGPDARPLGRVLKGGGNNGEDGTEGAVWRHVVGTYLHGSLLPKNPWLADALLEAALERRHGPVRLPPLDDELEETAHRAVLRKILG